MHPFEHDLIVGSALVALSVIASKASSRLGIPALLLFLVIGIGAGSHGLGGIHLKSYGFAQELGILALTFILFSGGMDTDLDSVRPVLKPALVLSTVGVIIAASLVGIFARATLGFSILEGLLLGAIIVSTDVAAVFAVLRSKNVSLKAGLKPLLELESALNDPMAVFLGVVLLDIVRSHNHSILELVPLFFQQMIVGALLGWGAGKCLCLLINRIKLEYDGLYPVLSLAWIVLTYGVTQSLGGSGFLAVYIAGILAGNANLLHRRSLIHFHEGAAWLGQIGMFLAMGLLVDPHELWAVAPFGIALSAFLVFIARPASVFVSLAGSRFDFRERLMVSWGGLRGSVPIILATYVLAAGVPKSENIFNLVFFVAFFSVLLQGTTISSVAKWLKVNVPFRETFRFPIEFNPGKAMRNKLFEVSVPSGSRSIGKSLVEVNLPKDILVVLIQREGNVLVPRGGTHLNEGDSLLILSDHESPEEIRALLS